MLLLQTALLGDLNRNFKIICFIHFLTITIQLNDVALHLKLNLFLDIFLLTLAHFSKCLFQINIYIFSVIFL